MRGIGGRLARSAARRLLNLANIEPSDAALRQVLAHVPKRSTPPFPVWDASEPSVRVTFFDLIKPTDTVFDIGAHIGGLSSVLSRMVGPNGKVIAFEASAATAAQLNTNLVLNGHNNVTVVHGAVYARSGELILLKSDGAASYIAQDGDEAVESIQLDRYCEENKLSPSFMKMDIESAEYDALRGAERILASSRPHIVFEHNLGDDRALRLLLDAGYIAFDASTYRQVSSSADCEPGAHCTNLIAIQKDRLAETPYKHPPKVEIIKELALQNGLTTEMLRPGRYILEIEKQPVPAAARVLFSRVSFGDVVLGELWTDAAFFMDNHRCLPFEARHGGEYSFQVGEPQSATGTLENLRARLLRVFLS